MILIRNRICNPTVLQALPTAHTYMTIGGDYLNNRHFFKQLWIKENTTLNLDLELGIRSDHIGHPNHVNF